MKSELLEKMAIKAAMAGAWGKAIEINQKILNLEPDNVAALNRLGRAWWETGDLKQARQAFENVLKIDQYNPIATKNLQRLENSAKVKKTCPIKGGFSGNVFLEEPGKTKTVKLTRLASAKILADLNSADSVLLSPRRRTINVSKDGTYLGTLPDDLSLRLIHLIKGGNRYQAWVKAVDCQNLEIFIRETFRSRKFRNQPSFRSSSVSYIPSLNPNIVKDQLLTTPTGEEEGL